MGRKNTLIVTDPNVYKFGLLENILEVDNIVLDRILFTSMVYPTNYGFILNTKGKD